MTNHDRRTFLASAALACSLPGTGRAENETNVTSEAETEQLDQRPIHVGIMGMRRGLALAASFSSRPGVQIKYVCDVDQRRIDAALKRLTSAGEPAPIGIVDFRRILDDPQIDALICAAPNHWHAPATIQACAAGKHVYVEKPCSHNPWEGEQMVAAARRHRRAIQVGTQRRSSPGVIQAIARLHSGAIGRVYQACAWYHNRRPTLGIGKRVEPPAELDYALWQGPAPPRPYRDNVVHYNWHFFWDWGNGELGNNGIHTLDLCRWGLDVDFPTRVTSSGGRYQYADDQETPDTHTVCFDFPGQRSISWQGMSCNRHGNGFVTFYGTAGALDLQPDGRFTIHDERNEIVETYEQRDQGDLKHIDNFLDAVRLNQPDRLSAEIEQGHRSTLLCHLGNIAHRVQRTLRCAEQDGHVIRDPAADRLWKREYRNGWEPKA